MKEFQLKNRYKNRDKVVITFTDDEIIISINKENSGKNYFITKKSFKEMCLEYLLYELKKEK